jgi:hypothetical protein
VRIAHVSALSDIGSLSRMIRKHGRPRLGPSAPSKSGRIFARPTRRRASNAVLNKKPAVSQRDALRRFQSTDQAVDRSRPQTVPRGSRDAQIDAVNEKLAERSSPLFDLLKSKVPAFRGRPLLVSLNEKARLTARDGRVLATHVALSLALAVAAQGSVASEAYDGRHMLTT